MHHYDTGRHFYTALGNEGLYKWLCRGQLSCDLENYSSRWVRELQVDLMETINKLQHVKCSFFRVKQLSNVVSRAFVGLPLAMTGAITHGCRKPQQCQAPSQSRSSALSHLSLSFSLMFSLPQSISPEENIQDYTETQWHYLFPTAAQCAFLDVTSLLY